MFTLIFVVFLTIFISAQCSLYEAVLYSIRLGTLEAAKAKQHRTSLAVRMIDMKKNIASPLSAILILNTIANTAGATIAGMYANQVIGPTMVPLFSIVFTLGILFLAEIMPKTLGAIYWRNFWPFIVWPLTAMKKILFPIIFVTKKFSDILTKGHKIPGMTEEEILGVVRLGAKEGEISKWESLMVHNIINLEKKSVNEIMTPRRVIFSLDDTLTVEEGLKAASEAGFTRIPLFHNDKEEIVGYVMIHDLISAKASGNMKAPLSCLAKPVTFMEEDTNCLTLMAFFLKKRSHIAIVEDKYGGVAGLITLEDVIETMLGSEIVDEKDKVVDMQKMARKLRTRNSDSPSNSSENDKSSEKDKS
jgi:CBS domain containing-hemolysin-like protein